MDRLATGAVEHLPGRLRKSLEATRDIDEIMLRARRQPQRTSVALQQLLAEERFEHADLLRDRALGHVRLLGGEGQVWQASGRSKLRSALRVEPASRRRTNCAGSLAYREQHVLGTGHGLR